MRRPREYVPHPGQVPTLQAARQRWTGGLAQRAGREIPYASFPERARTGDAPFKDAVTPQAGESLAELVMRLKKSGRIKTWAAYTTARGLLGFSHVDEGLKVVHAAELWAHRQSARFLTDPTPVRGKLLECTSPAAFRDVFPSVAVNVSALRHLEWSANLRPHDIFFLWILIAASFAGTGSLSASLLKKGFGVSRPHESLGRIMTATFVMNHGPYAPKIERPVIEDGVFHDKLFDIILPRAGGENYGYLDLYILGRMSATWQEKALRGLLATAVKTRIFWSRGGETEWRVSLAEAAELFSLSGSFSVDRLRKERLAPLAALLERDALPLLAALEGVPFYRASRVRFSHKVLRDGAVRGRPATGFILKVRILGSDMLEDPKGRYSIERTADRSKRQPETVGTYDGLDHELSTNDRRVRRSDAAKRGWQNRRNRRGHVMTVKPPRRPRPAALAAAIDRRSETPDEPDQV